MHAQYPLPPASQQSKSVNLLQLHALHWLYTHAQQNISNIQAHCGQGAGQQPFNYAQPNMNYFVPPQNGPGQHPINQFNPKGGNSTSSGIKQLYNHAQSAMQNLPLLQQQHQPQHNTSFVPPQCGQMQQPYNYAQHNPFSKMPQSGQVQQSQPPNISYMPPQCGQLPQPFSIGPQSMNIVPPPCGQAHQPDKPAINPLRNERHDNNLPSYNVPSATCQSNPVEPKNKHIYVNGALYNTELLEPPLDKFSAGEPEYPAQHFLQDLDFEEDDSEDEGYDPLDDTLPSVYGIRFYNPNNGPDGAIPKRLTKNKTVPSAKSAEPLMKDMPHYHGIYSPFPFHRMDNLGEFGSQENLMANEGMARKSKSHQDADQELADAANTAAHNYIASMSPNSKAKRRQGRSRSRGFTQSFGIVAPIKRSNQTPKENVVAAKNVLSLFDKKQPIKKWNDIDEEKANIHWDWPLPIDGNKLTTQVRSQTKHNTATKETIEF